jgi:FK506-binding protein 4/5
MKLNEKALLLIQPFYGYGESGAGAKIPPNSTLEFEVELVGWKSVSSILPDGSVSFNISKQSSGGWMEPKDGWEVVLDYVGKVDGEEFERKEAFRFVLGEKRDDVPPFLEEAVKRFKKDKIMCDDSGVLSIKAERFKERSVGGVLPTGATEDSVITYEIHLRQWVEVEELEGSSKESGSVAKKKLLEEGEGWEKPKVGSKVKFTVKAHTLETKTTVPFDESIVKNKTEDGSVDIEVVLGEIELPEAIEVALEAMKKNEKVEVVATGDWGYGNKLTQQYGLESTGKKEGYIFEIKMLELEKGKESWDLNTAEKLEDGEKLKEKGNALFKDGKLRSAARRYEKAWKYFQYEQKLEGEDKKDADALKLGCHLNLAQVYLKLEAWDKVLENTNKVTSILPIPTSTHNSLSLC